MTVREGELYYLPLSDLVKLLWVVDDDLDSHLHLGLLQAEVQASNLGVNDTLYHAFGKNTKSMFNRGNGKRIIKVDYTLQLDSMRTNKDIKIHVILLYYSIVWLESGATVYKLLCLCSFQSQCTVSHAYHCLRHQVRHSSKFKWEFNQL